MRAKNSIALSLFLFFLFAGIGHCGQCYFYHDIATPLIQPTTSKALIAQHVFNEEAEPLPAGVRLKMIVLNRGVSFPETIAFLTGGDSSKCQVKTFEYDTYGRVYKIRVNNPRIGKMVLWKSFAYESINPEAFIKKVQFYNPDTGKPDGSFNYVYGVDASIGIRVLSYIHVIVSDTYSWNDPQSEYNPLVFQKDPPNIGSFDIFDGTYISRDTNNFAIMKRFVDTYDPPPQDGPGYHYDFLTYYRRDGNGKLVRTFMYDLTRSPIYGPYDDTLYIRDSSGVLTQIRQKGGKPIAWYHYVNQ